MNISGSRLRWLLAWLPPPRDPSVLECISGEDDPEAWSEVEGELDCEWWCGGGWCGCGKERCPPLWRVVGIGDSSCERSLWVVVAAPSRARGAAGGDEEAVPVRRANMDALSISSTMLTVFPTAAPPRSDENAEDEEDPAAPGAAAPPLASGRGGRIGGEGSWGECDDRISVLDGTGGEGENVGGEWIEPGGGMGEAAAGSLE